jgi:hypothetical protein
MLILLFFIFPGGSKKIEKNKKWEILIKLVLEVIFWNQKLILNIELS